MRFISKKLSLIGLSVLLCGTSFAQSTDIKSLVNPQFYDELMKDKYVVRYRDDASKELQLVPNVDKKSTISSGMVAKNPKDYPFTYEALYLINKQDLLKESNSSAQTIDINDVARVCRSVSKMQGMKYYSTTRKKELVLYSKAFTISDSKSKTAIPDKTSGNANGQVIYSYLDDNSFGVTRYEIKYYQSENELLATFSNKDVMGIGPIKAIQEDNLKINLFIIDCDDSLLLYICADLDSAKFPGIKGQISESITSRMEAIYKWFLKQF